MSSKVFSFFDVSLLLLIMQSLVLATNAYAFSWLSDRAAKLLLALFILFSLFQLNTLLFWSDGFNHVYVYLVLLAIGFTFGPLVYLIAQFHKDESLQFNKKQIIHFIPLAIYPVYLILLYLSIGNSDINVALRNFDVVWYEPLHVALVMSMLATQIVYSVMACRLLLEGDQTTLSFILKVAIRKKPALMLAMIFAFYWVWTVLSFLASLIAAGEQVVSVSGSVGNIIFFVLLCRVCFQQPVTEDESSADNSAESESDVSKDPYRTEQVEIIVNAMEENQLYLNPELTLEQLAEHAQIQPRLVSTIINRRFNKNFFEFTNSYRVSHAKNLLRTSDKGVSMLDIMADSGFNSKSAFNRFFKKYTEMTPTQYRQAHRKKN